ncbi:MAG: putative diacylglycerol acyltransferase [Acidimicrobiales bacterium]|nr:putative diacylglycerol acyltransferase [Acidimicrobiales bacterium]
MSDVEALMWNLEKDPHLSSTFANLTLFDRPPDMARLRRRLERATRTVPRLRRKVVPAFGRLAPPGWIDDPDLDLDHHIRHIALPPGSDRRTLLDLAAHIVATPFDRTRPLWEFHVIEGLPDGTAAMVQKMHHTITDGEGGVRMSVEFIDMERDAPEPPALPEVEVDGDGWSAGRSVVATAWDSLTHTARRQAGALRRTVAGAAEAARHPSQLAGAPGDAVAVAQSLLRQVAVTDSHHSPLWTERSLRRRFEILQVPFDDVALAAKGLGGSINDLFVAAAAGGAGAYHRAKGVDVDELRMSMPVSTRTDRSVGGNAFTPTRVLVPVGADPRARFAEIHDRLAVTKRERAVALTGLLAGAANLLPTSLSVRAARQQVETVDFTTSNVRAAPFDLFIAGAHMEANHPLGPIAGTAFNLTTMSYNGHLDLGLHTDAVAIEDTDLLARCIAEAFDELIVAGGARPKRSATRPPATKRPAKKRSA